MNNKYEVTGIRHPYNPNLFRIRALRNIPCHGVRKGDLGGFIESEFNLSQAENCWVSEDAWISGSAIVSGNARVFGDASVSENAEVSGNASVSGNADIGGFESVHRNTMLYGTASPKASLSPLKVTFSSKDPTGVETFLTAEDTSVTLDEWIKRLGPGEWTMTITDSHQGIPPNP